MILLADIYSENTELVQTIITLFGIGFGSIFWAILFTSSD